MSSKSNSISNTSTKSWTLKELEGGDYSDSDPDLHSQYGNDASEPDSQYDNSEKNHSILLSASPLPEWSKFTVLFVSILGACTGFMTDDLPNHEGNKTIYGCIIAVGAACTIGILGALGMRFRQKIWATEDQTGATTPEATTNPPKSTQVTSNANQSTWSLRELEDESESDSDSESDESRLALLYKSESKRRGDVVAVGESNDWLKFAFAFCGIFVSTIAYLPDRSDDMLHGSTDWKDQWAGYWLENCVKVAMVASWLGIFVSFWHAAKTRGYRILVGVMALLLSAGMMGIWITSVYKRPEENKYYFGIHFTSKMWKVMQIVGTLIITIVPLSIGLALDKF